MKNNMMAMEIDVVVERIDVQGLEFVRTCFGCPEQYDVFDADGNQVSYVRLRCGHLKCVYPDFGGEIIYEESMDDAMAGCFANEDERRYFLEDIANAINRKIGNVKQYEKIGW